MNTPNGIQLRVPPHSIEAESSVLGSLLLNNESLDHVIDLLTDADFYRYEHRLVYGAINKLVNEGKPADVITVYEHLQSLGEGEGVGGLSYLNALAQFVLGASNIRRYAEIVRDKSILRKLTTAVDKIGASVYEPSGKSVEDLLSDAERDVLSISNNVSQVEIRSLDENTDRFIDRLQHLADNPDLRPGVKSGYTDLDHTTGGLQAGELVVIAGRPSMGKTALAMNIAEHAAFQQQLPVLVYSLEMSEEQLTQRIVGSVGRINQNKLRDGKLKDEDWSRVLETVELMRGKTIDIQDRGIETIGSIRAIARRAARKHKKLGLVVVDYLQLMSSGSDREENRNTEITQISRGLKLLAKELQCPVIALSQLNRGVENRGDKRPMMSDLRESGAIEQDADVIMFIYRDDYYTKEASKEPGVAEIIIAKQRNGPTGTVRLCWRPEYTRFDSLAY
jgi:replicative DNA helicase